MDDTAPPRGGSGLRATPNQALHPKQAAPRRPVWRRIAWIVVLLIVVGAIAYRVTHHPVQQTSGFRSSGPTPVGVASARKGDIKVTLNALGTVTPLATVSVLTQISGQLTEVGFREGQDVKQGDFLVQIDPRPYQAALDQAQGQLLKDQALLKEAQVDFARYKTLAAQNSIARQQAEDQEYVVEQDQGTVKVDEALVDNAKLNLSYCRIVAPVSGRIGLRNVDPGNYVQASGSTSIAVITQLQPITVVFALAEDSLPAVLKRMRSGTPLSVSVFDRSGATLLGTGTLAAVDSQINTSTGTVNLKALFDNADEMLFPNQFVNVSLLVEQRHDVVVIPSAAVQRGAPGTFVYVTLADDTVAVRPVKLGPVDGELVEIQSGLELGDHVVVDGTDKLRDGAKVSVRGPAGQGSDAAGAGTSEGQGKAGSAKRNRQSPSGEAPAGGDQ